MSTIIVTASFGTPPAGGGPCSGKGFCQVSSGGKSSSTGAAGVTPTSAAAMPAKASQGTTVSFHVSPIDKSVMMMSFKMSELEKSQPEQVPFFKSGEYNFDAHYDFHHPEFKELPLHKSPRIEMGKKNTVQIVGDMVTTFFHYSHE